MSVIGDSMRALDDFISNVSREEKDKIWLEVKEMNFTGPSVETYFNNVFNTQYVKFEFEEELAECGFSKPPDGDFKISLNETPNYSLESFFALFLYGTHTASQLSIARI
jgi:hypothetical protein